MRTLCGHGEPVAFGPTGLPAVDQNGGMWIKLTVCGVTRLGYGSADGKTGGDAVKELIGDALRNAAMRFGAALDLWHKGDLHADEEDAPPQKHDPAPSVPARITEDQRQVLMELSIAVGVDSPTLCGKLSSEDAPRAFAEEIPGGEGVARKQAQAGSGWRHH